MSEERNGSEVEVFQTNRFEKQMNKLSQKHCELVEDEIDKIIDNPEIGTRKKGDLSHLWVHKFKLDKQEVLLGYSWVEDKLELYLLNIGSHENYYDSMKKSRKADLKLIG
ncbi:type II toxin-antitoxin system RelE/ParE family toxin [Vibrio cholerae]|uniref:type II toxin-antitoxin system RelE/ParE family toxin n=1 Tax=Vibrio cholerae TaxID=666 RepID=UPI001A1EE16D|nr:type II toxin-antitoxin system RelE/ParE family toxin [Vibrio cholerae]EGQ7702666.1 type II toxin-antitoxin system RelE/ParE family toxin [Vibrio cholerae]EJL6543969.1 type II toxin-antitoxin system RelE/ParE family toxin [Vibrio cholerae]MBO1398511.1 addiction module toxin RelE [Vibrio cholerae]